MPLKVAKIELQEIMHLYFLLQLTSNSSVTICVLNTQMIGLVLSSNLHP